jgi:hypothetical protein
MRVSNQRQVPGPLTPVSTEQKVEEAPKPVWTAKENLAHQRERVNKYTGMPKGMSQEIHVPKQGIPELRALTCSENLCT